MTLFGLGREDDNSLNEIFELAHIAGPTVGLQDFKPFGRERPRGAAVSGREFTEKMGC